MADENMLIALEASWELDPVLMEDRLWEAVEENPEDKDDAVQE